MKANNVKALRDRRSKKCMNEKWRNLHKVNSLGTAHPTTLQQLEHYLRYPFSKETIVSSLLILAISKAVSF
jgi:hypothetical protein